MTLRKLSLRLGMHYGLYLGICIGIIVTALITIIEYLFLSLFAPPVLVTAISFLIGSVLVILIIFRSQRVYLNTKEQTCTCRFRSGLQTLCSQCGYHSDNPPPSDTSSRK